jgi:thiol-disulfide isomerase/thioredoxin
MVGRTVPRQSPELKFLDAGGREVLLSSFKGKVVVVEFLFLRSEHCMRVAQTLNRLNSELGQRGFQPVAVVFGPNANGPAVGQVLQALKLTYPMGIHLSGPGGRISRTPGKGNHQYSADRCHRPERNDPSAERRAIHKSGK